jgi:uncharacterized protein (DUF2164 family)
MTVQIDDERRAAVVRRLQAFFLEEFDEMLSPFRASQLLEFFLEQLGPQVYNQAVQDARAFMQQKLDDLDGDLYMPEEV